MSSVMNSIPTPPWMVCPHLSRFSLGWRMGYGEGVIDIFCQWLDKLNKQQRAEVQELFPEPFTWQGWWNEEEDDGDDDSFNIMEHGDLLVFVRQPDGQPCYSRQWLMDQRARMCRSAVMFWGHQPQADGKLSHSCMSQWWKEDFKREHESFSCAEQFMMASKADLFSDSECKKKIMSSSDPRHIKQLGRAISPFDESVWDRFKYAVVVEGNWYKFSCSQRLRDYLIGTGSRVLVEASPADRIWGTGLARDHEHACNPKLWRGENLLGFALMEVRDELRRVYANAHRCSMEPYRILEE